MTRSAVTFLGDLLHSVAKPAKKRWNNNQIINLQLEVGRQKRPLLGHYLQPRRVHVSLQ